MLPCRWRSWLRRFFRPAAHSPARRKTLKRNQALVVESLETRVVPAVTLYVDNPNDFVIDSDQGAIGVLDNGDGVTWNPGAGSAHGGPVSGLVFGTTAFGTVGSAVNAAVAGDTIRVAGGSFAESVNVNHQLTLLGNQFGVDARTARGPESIVS